MLKKNQIKESNPPKDNEQIQEDNGSSFRSLPTEQINKLRDAFQLIDNDNDGNISREDLQKTYESIGKELNEEDLKEMFSQFQNNISFASYLSLISNELAQLPNRNEIMRALQVFDQDGEINAKELKEDLLGLGMTSLDIDPVLNAFKSERMNGDQIFMGKEFLQFISS